MLTLDPRWVRFAPLTSSGVVIAGAALGSLAQALRTLEWAPTVDEHSSSGSGDPARRSAAWPRSRRALPARRRRATSSRTSASCSATPPRTAPGTCVAACSPPARPASTTPGSRASASVSRSASGSPVAHGCRRSSPAWAASSRAAPSWSPRRRAPRSTGSRPRCWARPDRSRARCFRTDPAPYAGAGRARWSRRRDRAASTARRTPSRVAGCWSPLAALPVGRRPRGRPRPRLGHAVVDGYLVARSGSLDRRREALATPSVIGWNLQATWFQRRAGLTDLVATTAGGRQSVRVLDVPADDALALAARGPAGPARPVPGLTGPAISGSRGWPCAGLPIASAARCARSACSGVPPAPTQRSPRSRRRSDPMMPARPQAQRPSPDTQAHAPPAMNRAGEPGHDRRRPVDVAAPSSEDQLGPGTDGHAEHDDGQVSMPQLPRDSHSARPAWPVAPFVSSTDVSGPGRRGSAARRACPGHR